MATIRDDPYSAPLFRLPGPIGGRQICEIADLATIEFIMTKQKTHKGIKKRFTVTANGKAKHRNASRGHLLSKKTGKRKRQLRKDGVLDNYQADRIVEALRPIL